MKDSKFSIPLSVLWPSVSPHKVCVHFEYDNNNLCIWVFGFFLFLMQIIVCLPLLQLGCLAGDNLFIKDCCMKPSDYSSVTLFSKISPQAVL